MIDQVFQCCYTHVSREQNGAVSTAWMPVAVSANLPEKLKDYCTRVQSIHSKKVSGVVDEEGGTLDLFEICGDGQNVYLLRTRFGGIDFGRANMFSHAYIFPWDSLTDRINDFLTVDLSNFAATEDEALEPKGALTRKPPLTLSQALDTLQLDRKNYVTLIRCVYAQMEQKAPQPLYVQYDGSEQQRDALLYCIYAGLPLEMSRRLSVATAPSATEMQRNLIFSRRAATHPQYINPLTGENNLLVGLAERKIRGLGFVDYAPMCENEADAERYLQEMSKTAKSLAGQLTPNAKTMKIAHQLITESSLDALDDGQLEQRIGDALSAKSAGSTQMEDYLAQMMVIVLDRGMALTDVSDEMLMDKLDSATDEGFISMGEQYFTARLLRKSEEDACRTLRAASPGMFRRYCKTLVGSEQGRALLDRFHAECVSEAGGDWADLRAALENSAYLAQYPTGRARTLSAVSDAAWRRYQQELYRPGSKIETLASYLGVMEQIVPAERRAEVETAAKDAYWETRTLDMFDFDQFPEYNAFAPSLSPIFVQYGLLFRFRNELATGGEEACLRCINYHLRANRQRLFTPQSLQEFQDAIDRKLRGAGQISDPRFARWIELAAQTPEKAFEPVLMARSALAARNYQLLDQACQDYQKALESTLDANFAAPLVRSLNDLVFESCRALDTPEAPLGADTWLMIGHFRYPNGNPFRIFDEYRPCVLDADPAFVSEGSSYLRHPHYQQCGSEYVRAKGAEFKTVKLWLKAAPQAADLSGPPSHSAPGAGAKEPKKRGLPFFGRRDS